MTRREQIRDLLSGREASIKDLADFFETTGKNVEIDLEHVRRTLVRAGRTLMVKPAECISCSYQFKNRLLIREPKKCPECHSERIKPQVFRID